MKHETMIDSDYKIPRVVYHEMEAPNFEARIAIALVERWGLVAGGDNGLDAAGRQKMRRLTPVELTEHACDTAASLTAEFAKRGWMIPMPSIVNHLAEKTAAEDA